MRAWLLDTLAIVVGVCLAEIVIQTVITPTVQQRMGAKKDAAASQPF